MSLNFSENSAKYLKARDKLPEELRDNFRQLVDEYSFHALQIHGRNWVAYDVIAELVKAGWHPPAEKPSGG